MVKTEIAKEYSRIRRNLSKQIKSMAGRGYFGLPNLPSVPKKITAASISRLQNIQSKLYTRKSTFFITEEGKKLSGTEGRKYERQQAAKKPKLASKIKENDISKEASKDVVSLEPEAEYEIDEYEGEDYTDNTEDTISDFDYSNEQYEFLAQIQDYIYMLEPADAGVQHQVANRAHNKHVLENILDNAIRNEGEEAVAKRLQAASKEIYDVINRAYYASGEVARQAQLDFAAILKGEGLNNQEAQEVQEMMDTDDMWEVYSS